MSETANKPPDSSFKTRVKSALILAPAVLLLLYLGGKGFAFMMAATAAIGVSEWAKMVLTGTEPPAPKTLHPLLAAIAGLGVITAAMFGNPLSALIFLLALCFMVFCYNYSQGGPSLRRVFFGVIYIGFACQIMIWLRNDTVHGLYNMLTLLLIVWASDIFAYFSGKSIGGPKLVPAISPKKTWAGLIGGSFGAGLVAAGLACPALLDTTGADTLGGMGYLGYLGYFILGFVLSAVGQVGDLFISLFKRHYGVKDTGTIIPGHGGILDRIDALLLVALVFGALARALGA